MDAEWGSPLRRPSGSVVPMGQGSSHPWSRSPLTHESVPSCPSRVSIPRPPSRASSPAPA
jgi:hypothetical protein